MKIGVIEMSNIKRKEGKEETESSCWLSCHINGEVDIDAVKYT